MLKSIYRSAHVQFKRFTIVGNKSSEHTLPLPLLVLEDTDVTLCR